jgi:hypothetical protein
MAASNSDTALQVNFKLKDGTLVNVYAKTNTELEGHLTQIQDLSTLISSVSSSLNQSAAANVAVAYATKTLNAAPVNGDAPTCKHGPMNYRTGEGAKGPWRAWMCSAPKGAVDKCDAVWVR